MIGSMVFDTTNNQMVRILRQVSNGEYEVQSVSNPNEKYEQAKHFLKLPDYIVDKVVKDQAKF